MKYRHNCKFAFPQLKHHFAAKIHFPRSNSDELVCITDSQETPQITTVLLKIDDLMISLSQGRDGEQEKLLKFTYLPDPTVTKVSPRYVVIYLL